MFITVFDDKIIYVLSGFMGFINYAFEEEDITLNYQNLTRRVSLQCMAGNWKPELHVAN